ncbi:MAG: toprim domain-containing protein [Geobacter sp.]|nr:toprim domain-containing protein [Geobacter sp.]
MEIRGINQLLTERAEDVAAMLIPAGRKVGREWEAGSVDGEQGRSLKVCVEGSKRGRWSDFATGESGDLLDLWQKTCGLSLHDALKEAKQYLGIQEPRFEQYASGKSYRKPQPPKVAKKAETGSDVHQYLTGRGLTAETIAAFRIGETSEVGPFEGWKSDSPMKGPWIVFPSFRAGELLACKYLHLKRKDDKKLSLVEPGCMKLLFGWQAVPDNSRVIVLTEGEIDAMTMSQYGFPALSVPFGGGKAGKQQWIETEFPYLERFEEILLAMDQDDEGQRAVEDIVNRLGRHRCRIIPLPFKDTNECLKQGVTPEQMAEIISSAVSLDPSELKAPTTWTDAVIDEFYPPGGEPLGFLLPWKMRKRPVRFQRGEVTIVTGVNGHGKTLAVLLIMIAAMSQGERVCIGSFEIHPRKTLYRMVRQALGKEQPTRDEVRGALEWFDGKLWIFDVLGTASTTRILEVFRYAYRRYGVTAFVIDSLLKCGISSEDYAAQKKFLDQLNDFVNETNTHIILIAHARKGQDENTPPGKLDVKGSGDITDLASNVWSCWRNKLKEADLLKLEAGESIKLTRHELERTPDALLQCFKARDDRNEEGKIGLFFHRWSLQYHQFHDQRPVEYCLLDHPPPAKRRRRH